MRIAKTMVLTGALGWVGAGVGVATAANVFTFDGTGASNNGTGLALANDLAVNTAVTIQSLGFYDSGLNGLSFAHNVNLYDITNGITNPTLLGSVTVQPGTTTGLSGGFEYVALSSPVSVAAGKTIAVVAYQLDGDTSNSATSGLDPYADGNLATNFTGGTDFTYAGNSYRFDNSTSGVPDPTNPGGSNGGEVFGAGSFQYTVPEPASLGLLSLVGIGLLARRRNA